jgi:hypothetical protein
MTPSTLQSLAWHPSHQHVMHQHIADNAMCITDGDVCSHINHTQSQSSVFLNQVFHKTTLLSIVDADSLLLS